MYFLYIDILHTSTLQVVLFEPSRVCVVAPLRGSTQELPWRLSVAVARAVMFLYCLELRTDLCNDGDRGVDPKEMGF